jgi:MYXO-CTERM domain-containing protein
VTKGVGGVHGTVDEPLNNCFPSRKLILDYTSGAPLSEAYLRRMPFVYWRNLVLGDPLLAPYAKRPVVTMTGLSASASVAQLVTVTAKDMAGSGIAKIQLFVDGKLLAEGAGDTLEACVPVHAGTTSQVLAVAQNAVGTAALAKFPPKGWTSMSLSGTAEGVVCASAPDGGTDGGTLDPVSPQDSGGGCSCRSATQGSGSAGSVGLALGVLLFLRRRLRNVAL